MIIVKQISIAKGIGDVWEVLGNQFGQIDKWASLISESRVSGSPTLMGLDYSVRTTKTSQGKTKQKLTIFDPANHVLSYKAIAGTPFFIRSVQATWSLTKKGDAATDLRLDFEFETKGIMGVLLTPMAKKKFSKLGDEILEDFKHYVENGTPHPRKLAAVAESD